MLLSKLFLRTGPSVAELTPSKPPLRHPAPAGDGASHGSGRGALMLAFLTLGLAFPGSWCATAQFAGTNVALSKPVFSSGPTWSGLSVATLTDGNPDSFTHPLASSGTLNYYFQVDLGRAYNLEGIRIRNRNDGCCPERLTRYEVQVYADLGGVPGALNWSSLVRTNGSNSGNGGTDLLYATNHLSGKFAGRFVRVVNRSGGAYNPQLAEIEVYGALGPIIDVFEADEDVLAAGESTTLRWRIQRAESAFLSGTGPVNAAIGSLPILATASTSYTLTASNEAGVVSAVVNIGVGVTLAPPLLTEFLASNSGGLRDEEGRSGDWIEIGNPNNYRLNLEGYSLTDDPSRASLWTFPNVRIPAGGHLVVFASGDDRRNAAMPLHTHFRLDDEGDFLALIDRDGRSVLQSFPASFPNPRKFPNQTQNTSYGLGGDGRVGFFRPPTPGQTNGTAADGVVEPVSFSAIRGFYTNMLTLVLTSATPGTVIRYTLGPAEPSSSNGTVYSTPIRITNTTIVRAAAFRARWAPPPVVTHTFIFPSNVVRAANMSTTITRNAVYGPQMVQSLLDIPTVSVVSQAAINDTTEVQSSFEWISADGKPSTAAPCGARWFGGAFTFFEKKNFRLYFRSEYGATKFRHPVFEGFDNGLTPADEFDELELRNGSHDMAMRGFYMSNIFADDTLLEMGQMGPHGRFVHMYLNGIYWGVFHLRERWGASMHSEYLGGEKDDYESINGNWNVGGWADPGTAYDGDGSVWELVKSLRGNYNAVRNYLDVPNYVDFMLTWMYGGSEDEYRCVGPRFPGSGFKFYINDADGWFCGSYYCAAGDRTQRGTPGRQAGDGPGSIFSMLHREGNADYRTLLADRIHASLFNNGPLSTSKTLERLARRTTEIERPFYAEAARWAYLSPSDWASRRNETRNDWLQRRPAEVLTQWRNAGLYPRLDAPVVGFAPAAPSGWRLSFKGPTNAPIYYTLDGRDPRLPGGAVSPFASSNRISSTSEIILPRESTWKWFSSTNGLGRSDIVVGSTNWSAANWKHPDYDDRQWNEGRGEFGFGDGDEVTLIPSHTGTNRILTTYFRRTLVLQNADDLISVQLRVKRDDGVIIYVNGAQAVRSQVPAGNLTGTSPGNLASDDGRTFVLFTVSSALFHEGTNTLAAELHQTTIVDDASFDVEVVALRARNEGPSLPLIFANHVVKARTLLTNQWSALNTLFAQVSPSPLPPGSVQFSEIHYHPTGVEDSEFVELMNTSTEAVNLRGARITGGISHQFASNRDIPLASGERVLLVGDVIGFQKVYSNRIAFEGRFSGNLANSGDALQLLNASGQSVSEAAYSDQSPWPASADGIGYSLVLAHPAVGATNPTAWRISIGTHGTPGATDSIRFTGLPSADLDQDGLTAWVEHALGTRDTDPNSGLDVIHAALTPEGIFQMTFQRNLQADDLRLQVEASDDLDQWRPANYLGLEPGGVPGMALERWGLPADAPQLFLRLTAGSVP